MPALYEPMSQWRGIFTPGCRAADKSDIKHLKIGIIQSDHGALQLPPGWSGTVRRRHASYRHQDPCRSGTNVARVLHRVK